jgi:preprotein translocase subunit SecA
LKTGVDKLHVAEQRTRIIETSMNVARKIYGEIVEKMGNRARLKDLERNVILRAMDRLWIDHLAAMTQLRTGIGLRGYGQLDPLVEYKKEAFGMFNRLLAAINEEIANNFFKVATHAAQAQQAITLGKSLLERAGVVLTGAVKTAGSTPVPSTPKIGGDEKVGRNDDCPCGSGKKYKKCHGA